MARNDDPTSLRREHGYQRATAAGITEFRVRSASEMNAMQAMKPMQKQLRALVEKNETLEPIILEIAKELLERKKFLVLDDIVFELEARKLVRIKRPRR